MCLFILPRSGSISQTFKKHKHFVVLGVTPILVPCCRTMLQEYKVSHEDAEPTYEAHGHKLSYPEDQPFGKAEGKPPAGRLWSEGRKPKTEDFRRPHLIQTIKTNFKAPPPLPKLSGLKGPLPPLPFGQIRKARQC